MMGRLVDRNLGVTTMTELSNGGRRVVNFVTDTVRRRTHVRTRRASRRP